MVQGVKLTVLLVCVIFVGALASYQQDRGGVGPVALRHVDIQGWKLLGRVLKREPSRAGIFVAPLSVYTLVDMLTRASGVESECQRETLNYLCGDAPGCNETVILEQLKEVHGVLNQTGHRGAESAIGNSLWVSPGYELQKEYVTSMEKYLKAKVGEAASVEPINKWAEEVTHGLIPQMLEPGLRFAIVMATAMYLKAPWRQPFLQVDGTLQWFTGYQGSRKQVFMMRRIHSDNVRIKVEEGAYTAVRLDHEEGDFYSVVALPDEGVLVEDIIHRGVELADRDDVEGWHNIPGATVGLPYFKVSMDLDMRDLMKDMGIKAIFDPQHVNLTRMTSYGAPLSGMRHKVYVSVNDTGLEAAATVEAYVPTSAPVLRPIRFIPDRPFLFAVYHSQTHALLFAGCLLDGNFWFGESEV